MASCYIPIFNDLGYFWLTGKGSSGFYPVSVIGGAEVYKIQPLCHVGCNKMLWLRDKSGKMRKIICTKMLLAVLSKEVEGLPCVVRLYAC